MTDRTNPQSDQVEDKFYGLLAEYDSPGALVHAAEVVRDAGFSKWDCFSPFPVHGIDPAMGIQPTILPIIVFCAGITGTALAILMQWWMNAIAWQWVAAGKPYFSLPQQIPIAFEATVLLAGITAFWSIWLLNKLPQVWHPLFKKDRFLKATTNGFFIAIETADPKFDRAETERLLRQAGATGIEECHYPTSPAMRRVPRPLMGFILLTSVLALVPFAFIAKWRASTSPDPHYHIIPDMDFQLYQRAQTTSPVFPDGRTERKPPAGTVARGELKADEWFYHGLKDGQWAQNFPPQVEISDRTMKRGQERFTIYCTPCHGEGADGNGMVHQRALKVGAAATGWVQPANLTQPQYAQMPVGQIFNTISNGIRTMPAYHSQIPEKDRWAIIFYLRAIQRSRNATIDDVPPDRRPTLH